MAVAVSPRARTPGTEPSNSLLPATRGSVRVDGKRLARGAGRLNVQGVTYGPLVSLDVELDARRVLPGLAIVSDGQKSASEAI